MQLVAWVWSVDSWDWTKQRLHHGCVVLCCAQDMYLEQQWELTLTKKTVVIQKTVFVLVTYRTSFASGKGSAVSNKYKDCFLVVVHLSSVSHPNNTTTLLPTLCHGARCVSSFIISITPKQHYTSVAKTVSWCQVQASSQSCASCKVKGFCNKRKRV